MKVNKFLLEELHIFNARGASISSIFDETKTLLGKDELIRIFQQPLNSYSEIICRQNLCKRLLKNEHFYHQILAYPIDSIYQYLNKRLITSTFPNIFSELWHYTLIRIKYPEEYKWIQRKTEEYFKLLHGITIYYQTKELALENIHPFEESFFESVEFIRSSLDEGLSKGKRWGSFLFQGTLFTIRLDYLFRVKFKKYSQDFIKKMAQLDAYFSISLSSQKQKLTYPTLLQKSTSLTFELHDFYHPLIQHPETNSISLHEGQHQIILTGPNTSGKSTLLRAIGICIYLAHLGCPIPAKSGYVPLLDNLEISFAKKDNLLVGESLFSSQLDQLERLMNGVKEGERVLGIFDELFSGTNHQDNTACSHFTLKELSKFKNLIICVSTHNQEFAYKFLKDDRVLLQKLEMKLKKNKWSPTFHLEEGVSNQNFGLTLLKERDLFS